MGQLWGAWAVLAGEVERWSYKTAQEKELSRVPTHY